jgi:hypothetical protein
MMLKRALMPQVRPVRGAPFFGRNAKARHQSTADALARNLLAFSIERLSKDETTDVGGRLFC